MSTSTTRWSSGVAFYLATIGAAVGLGSIWRFPYLVGAHGGSAFVLVFVLACLAIAIPLLAAEFLVGRRARTSPMRAVGVVAEAAGRSRAWNAIGVLGVLAAFLIISYYTAIAGWVLAYAWKCATGSLAGLSQAEATAVWEAFLASPGQMLAWQAAFLALVGWVSARGVNRGVEIANRWRAPVLFALLAVLVAYALATGDVARGLAFAFQPDFSKIDGAVLVAAVGQAFFATGVGMAMMITYGAYAPADSSVVRSGALIAVSILIVSLMATVVVFPLVFRFGMDPAQGPELVFVVLPAVFAEMPGGTLVGATFFVMLVVAALTPSLAGFETVVSWLEDRWHVARPKAVAIAIGSSWAVGLASILSFNVLASWHPLDAVPAFAGKTWFDVVDYVASNVLLPAGALLTSLFVGWRLPLATVEEGLAQSPPLVRRLCVLLLRWVCPVALAFVLVAGLR